MELTKDQQEGLKVILERYKNKEKYVTICGYAGVGKSTLVKFAIEALGVNKNKVAYACFTGKAAEVLRKKGNPNAITLHKLLYDSFPKPNGGFVRKPKVTLEYDIIVADECSMIPKSMVDMLLRHKVFVIFLGDSFQLPQIDKNESHDLLENAHVFLSQITRQEAESEIIQLTMKIRNGEDIPYMKGKEVMVIPKSEFTTGHMKWADQIICATNKTRETLNKQMRNLLGYSGDLPQDGEKMICLRNYWDDISEDGEFALVNGTTGIIRRPYESYRMAPPYSRVKNKKMENVTADFYTEEGAEFCSVEMDKQMLLTGEYSLDWRESYDLGKLKKRIGDIAPRQFTYGYAMTCWKAQGSEWDKVLVVEENFPFSKEEHAKFLYTACTRATSKLVLIRND